MNLPTEFRITSRVYRIKHSHDGISDENHFQDIENKYIVKVFVSALDRSLSDIDSIQASMEKITVISTPDTKEPSDPNSVCVNVLKKELKSIAKYVK